LNNEAYVFSFELDTEKNPEKSNQKFEVNHDLLRHSMQSKLKTGKTVLSHQPAERVVDLHIEKITKDYKGLSNNDIVEIQLSYFQRALNAALRSHLDHMYVIHGLGKGVLKNRVFDILKTYDGIKEFRNDYHPRFGWGATEIIFK
jgi:dsDNA-specific endonuclease/ATPase MutS2